MVYPEKITRRIERLQHTATCHSNAIGTEANFSCGSFVRFSLSIDIDGNLVADSAFASNGCGFMLAAADVLAKNIIKRHLVDLHGLNPTQLAELISDQLGEIPPERRECIDACINALRSAFADFRSRQIEEFRGEKAFICTCFGVTEETIESFLLEPGAVATGFLTVDDIARATNAGSGCGSCRMLIQEMLDTRIGHV